MHPQRFAARARGCCHGGVLTLDEALELCAAARKLGVEVRAEAFDPGLSDAARPRGGLCTIHDQERFQVCRTFRCKLLKAYQAGEIGREEARATVQKALALRSAVTDEEPDAWLGETRRRLRRELGSTKERPRLHLKIAALDYFLERWFRS